MLNCIGVKTSAQTVQNRARFTSHPPSTNNRHLKSYPVLTISHLCLYHVVGKVTQAAPVACARRARVLFPGWLWRIEQTTRQ